MGTASPPGRRQAHALVIDDEPDVRDLLAEMLEAAGFEVVAPATSSLALKEIAGRRFDVVVTDVLMPDVDGIEVIRAARKANPGCRVVAISGGSDRLPAPVGLRLTEAFGADAVLYKPFARKELLAAIEGRPAS